MLQPFAVLVQWRHLLAKCGQDSSLVQAQASGLPEVLTAVSDLHVRQAIGDLCFENLRAVPMLIRPLMVNGRFRCTIALVCLRSWNLS